ncbi:hypothetical protein MGA3_05060 [Bacillus methanolicus MGA3]|nr:hypothetical protein MGA3_05060 [Bacillus methanolicus MGA3]
MEMVRWVIIISYPNYFHLLNNIHFRLKWNKTTKENKWQSENIFKREFFKELHTND